jgi:hypothetical protein
MLLVLQIQLKSGLGMLCDLFPEVVRENQFLCSFGCTDELNKHILEFPYRFIGIHVRLN